MAMEAERIELTVELVTSESKNRLGRELAIYAAQLARNNGLSNSRRWPGLADRLAAAGCEYIDDLAKKIGGISTSVEAHESFGNAANAFLAHLDAIFQDQWRKSAPWRMGKDSPAPKTWSKIRPDLEKQVRLHLLAIEDGAEGQCVERAKSGGTEKKKGRRGRTKGSGSYHAADARLILEMKTLIAEQKAFSADGAAKLVARKAVGGGTEASKATRLAKGFRASENKSG